MEMALRVLLVEDDRTQAKALRLLVQELGYQPVGWATSAPEALEMFAEAQPDLVLLDIGLAGPQDGVELAHALNARRAVPLIFLTSADDRTTFERAKAAGPFAFLIKPYDTDALARAIELAVLHYARVQGTAASLPDGLQGGAALVPGALYVRENNRLLKIHFDELHWLQSDDSHVHFHTSTRKYTVRISLRELEEKLPAHQFVVVRRGVMARIASIETVDLKEGLVWVQGQGLPIGRTHREELLQRLNLAG